MNVKIISECMLLQGSRIIFINQGRNYITTQKFIIYAHDISGSVPIDRYRLTTMLLCQVNISMPTTNIYIYILK